MKAVREGRFMAKKGGSRRRKVQSTCIHRVYLLLSESPPDSDLVFEENKAE